MLSALGVVGHRQVTDAYLLAVAHHHGAKLATLDPSCRDVDRGAQRPPQPR